MDSTFFTKDIDLHAQVLGLEAFNLKPSVKAIKELLPNFVNSVTSFYNSFVSQEQNLVLKNIDNSIIKKNIKDVNYASVRKMMVMGPKGLKTTYLNYIEEVEYALIHTENLMDKVLNPFANWILLLLATPENLKSVQNYPITPVTSRKKLEDIRKGLLNVIDSNSNQQKFLYGKLVTRNKDWLEIIERTNTISSRFLATNRSSVKQKVSDISEALEKLIIRMEEDPETYKLSGVTVSSIAEQCYTVGKEIEHYAATGFIVQELITSVQDTIKQLEDYIKK